MPAVAHAARPERPQPFEQRFAVSSSSSPEYRRTQPSRGVQLNAPTRPASIAYVAEAGDFVSDVRDPDDYEIEAAFRPVAEVEALSLSRAERLFLDMALKRRTRA